MMSRAREETHWVSVEGQKVSLALHLPERAPAPCVVACHGLAASKASDKYLLLGQEFPRHGLALCRFDFRGCGESDGSYAGSTVAGRIRDLKAVLDAMARHPDLDGRFGLLGSSMGGFVALFVAGEAPAPVPVVTWNSPATLRGLEDRRDGDVAALGPAFFAELETRRYADAPSGVSLTLTIQGDRDEVVPPEHGRGLFERAAEPRAIHILSGADHRLSDAAHRAEAVALSLRWFRRCLGEVP